MIEMIEVLVEELGSNDGVKRLHARERLIEMGATAVPALMKALKSPSEQVRWEAAKALIALGRGALVPVLRGVERCVDNFWLKTGTIHVLHTLVREGVAPEAAPVLEALEDIAPRVEAPVAAYHVLQQLLQKRAA